MIYGISSMDTMCDYTTKTTLEECKHWVLSHLGELESENAKYIMIVNHDNPDSVVFYQNVKWENGRSNLKEIADMIVSKKTEA